MESSYKFYSITVFGILLCMVNISCKKLVNVQAPDYSINGANVYTNDATATAVLTGIYAKLSGTNSAGIGGSLGGFTSMSLFPSLSADELQVFDPNSLIYSGYYRNALASSWPVGTADYWSTIYPFIFTANSAIEGLNGSTGLTPAVKQQLTGEAKFIRAFCYFYLVNLYGDVPLVVTTDYHVNAVLPRTPKAQVWQQITSDLQDAENLLSPSYLKSDALTSYPGASAERTRPTKWAAAALLARTYLYAGDYVNAETQASLVINNSSLYSLATLSGTFKMNSTEAIWQLQAVGTGTKSNTGDGQIFVLPAAGPNTTSNPVFLNTNFVNGFEAGDLRKTNWISSVTPSPGTITYYFPYKYKIGAVNTTVSEYSMVLRLAEQYLIRAEARAEQGNIAGSQSDINVIRTRAGLANTTASSQMSLITAIQQERKSELFTEWGHRWFDLKRTNTVDAVMSIVTPAKGGTWETTDQLYPIPLQELQKNPELIQNPGY